MRRRCFKDSACVGSGESEITAMQNRERSDRLLPSQVGLQNRERSDRLLPLKLGC